MTDLKNREAFEDWFSCNALRDHVYVRGERMDENGNYYSEYAYLAWEAWQARVPEGYVCVPVDNNEGELKRLCNVLGDATVEYKATLVAKKSMIEAQESDND